MDPSSRQRHPTPSNLLTSARAPAAEYEVIKVLGRGGMAQVLLALQHLRATDARRLVVVKRALLSPGEDALLEALFRDEARLAMRMSHPHVVQTLDAGEDVAGGPFLVMEFLDGQPLNRVRKRAAASGARVPVRVALRVVADALDALHYVHELRDYDGRPLGVVHRDATPSNVFVTYDGVTKLVDFGVAEHARRRERSTVDGRIKGKLSYLAPEQLLDEPVTRAADVWAMGIVLWETIAGRKLFARDDAREAARAVLAAPVPSLCAERADVPAAVDAAVRAAVERDLGARVGTAEQLRQALEAAAAPLGGMASRREVAAFMREQFAEVLDENTRAVRDYLERTDPALEASYRVVRTNGRGAAASWDDADITRQRQRHPEDGEPTQVDRALAARRPAPPAVARAGAGRWRSPLAALVALLAASALAALYIALVLLRHARG